MQSFIQPGENTSPGKYSKALDVLPDDVGSLVSIVRGLLLHSDLLELYGLSEVDFSTVSRETLPLEQRLDQIFLACEAPLARQRNVNQRVVGTCRDYALMICAMLRHKQIPARVRCGFERYFTKGQFGDHWICEFWQATESRWVRVDAELDAEHQNHYALSFDTTDLPTGEFLTSVEAWQLFRNEGIDPNFFGHGDASGAWFLWVNLARDCLYLQGQEISNWTRGGTIKIRRPRYPRPELSNVMTSPA